MTTLQFIAAAVGIFIVMAALVLCYATLWAEPREDDIEKIDEERL